MSVQEPRNQFERESVEDEIEESQDSVDESLLADSDTSLSESESVDVPSPTGETDLPPESSQADETDEDEVPAIDSMPVSSSDELPAPEPTDGPAWSRTGRRPCVPRARPRSAAPRPVRSG